MVILGGGKGAWTTTFYPDISNGFGANIRVPAAVLNGQVVYPGQQFSFLRFVGPIDPAHGFTLGGVIEQGKSNHTGAMGGGICSASTTMFNAAARAGLQIDERHAHFYYISRYPVGLDATVFSNGGQTWDLKWTNDTPNPIVIRAYATHGSTSRITIQLWSLPLDRTVTFSPEYKANVVRAGDITVYTTKLKPGQKVRAEYPTNGFSTARTRTVTDSTGKVIHKETWKSKYTRVTGILQIGVPAAPVSLPGSNAPMPNPGIPAPSTLAPTANPAPALRRRSAGRIAL
jgi:vancomycin resistance protein YoaR